jgi:cobalt-zinc-cadmium efflux system outer membrane protein
MTKPLIVDPRDIVCRRGARCLRNQAQRISWWLGCGLMAIAAFATPAVAQAPMSWQDAKARLETVNPSLKAGQLAIEESRAAEITAYLRPNPQLAVINDQINPAPGQDAGALSNLITVASVSYLHEREHKRELRRESAQGATAIAVSTQADLERNLLFTLRSAFVQVLQAKAFSTLAQDNLSSYDQVLALSRDRFRAGDIAQIDLDRLTLQRVQYESDVQTALVNLRTAKIQLLRLLNDRTPIDQFDVTGPYEFAETLQPIDDLRRMALDTRPDLRAALQANDKAKTDHRLAIANGSTDPTIAGDAGFPQSPDSYTPPLNRYVGVSVSVPLRIFDRNQGEKLRTDIDIRRAEQLSDVARAQVLSDVDSAYATLTSTIALLRPYRNTYLAQATSVRDTMTFSYQRGGASLLDFMQAQQEYRAVQISYVNLIAAYLTAAAQLNLAIGQEVIQ